MITVEQAREIRARIKSATDEEVDALMKYVSHVEYKLSRARAETRRLEERLRDIEAIG